MDRLKAVSWRRHETIHLAVGGLLMLQCSTLVMHRSLTCRQFSQRKKGGGWEQQLLYRRTRSLDKLMNVFDVSCSDIEFLFSIRLLLSHFQHRMTCFSRAPKLIAVVFSFCQHSSFALFLKFDKGHTYTHAPPGTYRHMEALNETRKLFCYIIQQLTYWFRVCRVQQQRAACG